ncbi:hypothetical protein PPTG_23518 [Phytophthora nicotianae INRA-310]|uniref:Uncharacterized protein n=1 Tax=Phytophthora nicotianae (strain INRA-310) TaxID=761204 RepID=W2PWY2_PHYN3|nr:hypothetical protein PPTG_23518 [Phytophthora nicotianae INRA-310]ETN05463.1 hypothetical protein PPTG_23518 [Phytophthora nicotianae INRA-310]
MGGTAFIVKIGIPSSLVRGSSAALLSRPSCSIKQIAATSYPRISSVSSADIVVEIPPSLPSPTSTTGSRMPRYTSTWNLIEAEGLHTPPAVSTSTRLSAAFAPLTWLIAFSLSDSSSSSFSSVMVYPSICAAR